MNARYGSTWLGPAVLLALGACQRSPQFAPAVTLSARDAAYPTVAVDPRNGAVYTSWAARTDSQVNIVLARTSGTGFGAPVRVNDRPGDGLVSKESPSQVAVGPEGNVYVLWANRLTMKGVDYPGSNLRFARSTDDGKTFQPTLTVNDDSAGRPSSHRFHDLAVAPDGSVYAVWLDQRAVDQAARPRKGMGGKTMNMGPEPEAQIRVARSSDGGRTFSASTLVDSGTCICCRTAIAVGPDGTVYVMWRKVYPSPEGTIRDMAVSRSSDGGRTFGPPVRVHADEWVLPACPDTGPNIAVDSLGRVHVAWYTGKTGFQGMHYSISRDGGRTFEKPLDLVTGDGVPASLVKLVTRGARVWAVWEHNGADTARIQLARIDDGRSVHVVEQTLGFGRAPTISASAGRIAVSWLDGDAARVRVAETP